LHADFVACNAFDVRDQIGQITVPTLVISGDKDKMTPVENGRFLAEHIPNAQLAIVEGGGHMMALEQPAVVADLVKERLM
jgi:pimeloyl-ACP methyl ester carboxylesterase